LLGRVCMEFDQTKLEAIDGFPSFALGALHSRYPTALTVHFGHSRRSRFYPQALELAEIARSHVEHGSASSRWHSVVIEGVDLDLLALLYKFARRLPYPKVLGADVLSMSLACRHGLEHQSADGSAAKLERVARACEELRSHLGVDLRKAGQLLDRHILRPVQEDMNNAMERLQLEGFLDRRDPDDPRHISIITAWRKPREIHPPLISIREHIQDGQYERAVEEYYRFQGDAPYGELTRELLYLKRLGGLELSGRDVLYFLPPVSRSPLVDEFLAEYIECLDEEIAVLPDRGHRLVDILKRESPTMDELVRSKQDEVDRSVWLEDSKLTRDTSTKISPAFFGARYGLCPDGRIFDKYPDQVALCEAYERDEDPKYHGFWITYDEDFIRKHIGSQGLLLQGIDAYRHTDWNWRGKRGTREPAFDTAKKLQDIEKSSYGISGLRFTGRQHSIQGTLFHEVDLVRYQQGDSLGNPFLEAVHEVLREGKNRLRENHGLPRIGEGWVSELRLLELVRGAFPNAEHHSTPEWLRPQHLDIYVPEQSLAIEYQGRQHFEPIDFFGGQEAYDSLKQRDARKARKCKQAGIRLIAWHYSWPLTRDNLRHVLARAGHTVCSPGEATDDS